MARGQRVRRYATRRMLGRCCAVRTPGLTWRYTPEEFHWVYRDEEGDVLDPNPVNQFMPADDPRMKQLDIYSEKILTLSVSR